MSTEVYFPRGPRPELKTFIKRKEKEKPLFAIKKKLQKKESFIERKRKQEKKRVINWKLDQPVKLKDIVELTCKSLTEGMVLAGCVRKISSSKIEINLPDHISAYVNIDKISTPYTELLQALIDRRAQPEDVVKVADLFKVGELVTVSVDKISQKDNKKYDISLSLNPLDINKEMNDRCLVENLVLMGAIQSKEDHGFMVDLGIKSVTAFLPTKNTTKYIADQTSSSALAIGKIVRVVITKVKRMSANTTVVVSLNPDTIKSAVPENGFRVENLTPGNQLQVTIRKVLPNGLEVSPLHTYEDIVSYVSVSHVPDTWGSMTGLRPGMVLSATHLYTIHPVKIMYFSLKPHLQQSEHYCHFGDGAIVNDAKVIGHTEHGILFQLGPKDFNAKGYVPRKQTDGGGNFFVGETFTVRVLQHDFLEQRYTCTLKKEAVSAEFFTEDDLYVGQAVKGTVKEIINGKGLHLMVGHVKVFAPILHLSDYPQNSSYTMLSSFYKINTVVLAKVLSKSDRGVIVTLKSTLVSSPALCRYEDATPGSCYYGTVQKIVQSGVVVWFYNNITGFIQDRHISSSTTGLQKSSLYQGQTVRCYVLNSKPETGNLYLSLIPEMDGEEIRIGANYSLRIQSSSPEGLNVFISNTNISGFLPIHQLSEHVSLSHAMLEYFSSRDRIKSAVLYTFNENSTPLFSLRKSVVEFLQENGNDVLSNKPFVINKKMIVPCTIHKIERSSINVNVDIPRFTNPHSITKKDLFDEDGGLDLLQENQAVMAVAKPKGTSFSLDLRASQFLSMYKLGIEILEDFIKTTEPLQNVYAGTQMQAKVVNTKKKGVGIELKEKRLKGKISRKLSKKIFKINDILEIVILWQNPQTKLCFAHPVVEVFSEGNSDIDLKDASYVPAQVVLVQYDFILGLIQSGPFKGRLTFLPARSNPNDFTSRKPALRSSIEVIPCRYVNNYIISETKQKVKEISEMTGQKEKFIISQLRNNTRTNFIVTELVRPLNKSGKQKLRLNQGEESTLGQIEGPKKKKKSKEFQEFQVENPPSLLNGEVSPNNCESANDKKGKKKKRKLKELEQDKVVNNSDSFVDSENTNKKLKINKNSDTSAMKVKRKREKSSLDISGEDQLMNGTCGAETDHSQILEESMSKKPKKNKVEKNNDTSVNNVRDNNDNSKDKNISKSEKSTISLQGYGSFTWDVNPKSFSNSQEDETDESDAEEENSIGKRKEKLTTNEKREAAKESEKRIRRAEQQLLEAEKNPQSVDHFERLTLAHPNSSLIWIKYMALHLEATEIEKARAVAKRALEAIGHREEQERLNVWLALLNLENLYGTEESLKKTINDAVRANDEYKVYSKMAEIYSDSKKVNELTQLTGMMVRKFKTEKECWLHCCRCLIKAGLLEKSRYFFRRGLQALLKRDHVEFITRHALLENSFGSPEHAETVMDHVITSYPGRLPAWTTYIDMLIKSGKIDAARQVLERAVNQKLPARKMKTLYKMWLNFEVKHGTEANVSHVRVSAEKYVNSLSMTIDSV